MTLPGITVHTPEGHAGRRKILAHITSVDAARNILLTGFQPGNQGMCGPGIYFGDCIEDCLKKAHQGRTGGAYLVCTVEVGVSLVLSGHNNNKSVNEDFVRQRNCSSVHWVNPQTGSGEEWVVYSKDKIKIQKIVEFSLSDQQTIVPGRIIYSDVLDTGNACQNGFGIKRYPDGAVFEGQWVNGKREGRGTNTYGPKNHNHYKKYEGNYHEDKKFGAGKMTFVDGAVFEGQWNGEREGRGTNIYPPGRKNVRYEGDYHDNEKHGFGKMWYRDQSVYEGQWVSGKREGRGVCTYGPNSPYVKYEGDYHNDEKHGRGKMIYKNGSTYEGIWVNGKEQHT